MRKLKYIFKRIGKMNFKNYFKVINSIHKKTGKLRIYLLIDTIICGFKYQAGYMDYQLFEMYKMNGKERETVLTRGKSNDIVKKYNNREYIKYFESKVLFNERFKKYLNRDYMVINGSNYDEFKDFISNKGYIIVKPVDGTCGKGVEKIKVVKKNLKSIYEEILKNGQILVEEVAIQNEKLSKLHPTSINTVRIYTLNQKIVAAFLRIGNNNNVVDNLNHEGIVSPLDIDTGVINYPAYDKTYNTYFEHPITHEKLIGFKVPMWEKVKKLCIDASNEIKEVGYVGWDVCVGETKPFLIEANDFPGHDIFQLPAHREGNIGVYPRFQQAMKEDNDENSNSKWS